MDRILVFGANGQDGRYLSEFYRKFGCEVFEVGRSTKFPLGDISSKEFVDEIINKIKPDIIFHLAARSSTRYEFLFENHQTINTGSLNILDAVYRFKPECKVFITGSGLQFVNKGEPIHETNDFEANSAYSLARIHSAYTSRFYRSLGLRVYIGYLFHHESPFRGPSHLSQAIVQLCRRIENGSTEIFEIGDLTVEKEMTFAGDIINGIVSLVNQDKVFEATIGSGVPYTVKDWVEICFHLINKDWHDYIILKNNYNPEYSKLVSDPSTITSLGWKPLVSIETLAEMMLTYESALKSPRALIK